jgi:hypothetical protein
MPDNLPLNLWQKVAELQARLPLIPKSATNPHYKSKYADFPTIMEVVKPLLTELKLVYLQPLAVSDIPGMMRIKNILIDAETGQSVEYEMSVPLGNNLTPQAYGSAVTYARRYSMASMLNLVTDEDDDGNAASFEAKVSRAVADRLNELSRDYFAKTGNDMLKEVNARKNTRYRSFSELPQSLADGVLNHYQTKVTE